VQHRNNQVSLDIIKALIQSCHRDLNLFSKYVVDILEMILGTRDLDLIDIACGTFVIFCTYHDGSTLVVDPEFTSKYESLVRKFAQFCQYENGDNTVKLNLRYIGHRGLQGAVTSEALHASDFNTQLSIILPPILDSLSTSQTSLASLADNEEGSIDIRQSALDRKLTELDVVKLALQNLQHLFRAIRGSSVRQALVPYFEFLDRNGCWWPTTFAVSVTEIMLQALQPQYRYILVSELLQYLDNVPIGNQNENATPKQASLVSMLHSALNSDLPLVGISVMEILNTAFNYLVKSIKHRPDSHIIPNKTDDSQYNYAVYNGLTHSISGLAKHIYYANQVNDIIGYIVAKLRPQTTLKDVDGISIARYRQSLLQCLTLVVEKCSNEVEQSVAKPLIALDVLIPALGLLSDNEEDTRRQFADAIGVFIQRCASWTGEQYVYLAQEDFIQDIPRQRPVAQVTVMWVQEISRIHNIQNLPEYSLKVKEAKIRDGEWSHKLDVEAILEKKEVPTTLAGLNDEEKSALNAVNHWLDRHSVVANLMEDHSLREPNDSHGLDLESKLYAEWNTINLCK
ncbi:hypothetical protein BGW37DRAFT_426572, partial [Umbelopsis sp. PMI_123]